MRDKRARIIIALALTTCCIFPMLVRPQNSPEDESAQYAADGQRALSEGHYEEAQAAFEKLEKLNPGVAEVHATLAAIEFQQKEYSSAIHEIQTAQRLKPNLPRLDSLLGLSLAELGQFSEALPRLEKGFRDPSDPEVRRMCGLQLLRAYTSLGRDADAVETALALNHLYPKDPEVLYNTGRIYGNFAYIIMERLHDQDAGSIWMLQAQGEANEAQKSYDAALAAFNHVLLLDPKRPGIHYREGRIYLDRYMEGQKPADRDAAMREFAAELAIDPANGNAAYELANMDIDQGNLDKARSLLEGVVKLYPDFPEALIALGRVDLENHDAAEAVTMLKRATKLEPNDEVAWYRLSLAQREAGNREGQVEAMAQFTKLHRAAPAAQQSTNAGELVTPQKLDSDTHP